jgi:hypothetical protein
MKIVACHHQSFWGWFFAMLWFMVPNGFVRKNSNLNWLSPNIRYIQGRLIFKKSAFD